ncbi:MAG: hypothetical protein QNK15_02425 [Cycloclasticus sp.]|nr:hypothetical protein [Cycloclasticus sp.]
MDIATLALAATLTCQLPANDNLVGLWESTAVSRGGIGSTFEFREDGSYTAAVTVLVDLAYGIKDGRFFMSHNKNEPIDYNKGTKIEITTTGFSLIGDDGKKEIKTKEVSTVEKTIVGVYKYRHYTGGVAHEKYTSDGLIKFRLPMSSDSGCYSIKNKTVVINQSEEDPSEMKYKITKGMLELRDSKGKYSYKIVSEGAWYQSKEIDYQKPTE